MTLVSFGRVSNERLRPEFANCGLIQPFGCLAFILSIRPADHTNPKRKRGSPSLAQAPLVYVCRGGCHPRLNQVFFRFVYSPDLLFDKVITARGTWPELSARLRVTDTAPHQPPRASGGAPAWPCRYSRRLTRRRFHRSLVFAFDPRSHT